MLVYYYLYYFSTTRYSLVSQKYPQKLLYLAFTDLGLHAPVDQKFFMRFYGNLALPRGLMPSSKNLDPPWLF